MQSPEFYHVYGTMRHEELMRESAILRLMRQYGDDRRSAVVELVSRLLAGAGRLLSEVGRRMETAGRQMIGKPAHG